MYFTCKILVPEVFTHRDPLSEPFKKSFKVMKFGCLPKLTDEGRRVILFSHSRPDGEDYEPEVLFKRISMMLDILLLEGVDYVGCEVVIDCTNVCFSQLTRYDLSLTKKTVDVGLKAIPQRVHRIHMVNPNSILDASLSLFRPILPKKLTNRFIIHRDFKSLPATLGLDCTPSDLGGDGPSTEEINNFWEKKLIAYRDWFIENDHIKTDESKRIGKCRYENNDCTFGHQGSFKKMEVD
ncbi:hypothetical protein O3M35_008621 [Rhynocoris fuscipes]|uniref:CRAL-TRIO domain-containing protein n=1 Tax=Rhynocoris fuscipes TaxID=488301 RepID=A0AAW1D9M9_9HEMI